MARPTLLYYTLTLGYSITIYSISNYKPWYVWYGCCEKNAPIYTTASKCRQNPVALTISIIPLTNIPSVPLIYISILDKEIEREGVGMFGMFGMAD